jgi:hypothetical protein
MRNWRWLGLVLAVLWLVGFGVWLWINSVGDRHEWYALQLQRCYSSSGIGNDCWRALELARANVANRPSRRAVNQAHAIAMKAHEAAATCAGLSGADNARERVVENTRAGLRPRLVGRTA